MERNEKAVRSSNDIWLVFMIIVYACVGVVICSDRRWNYEGWNFNSDNYLFTTDTK